jgi:predicted nucleic acid-binding protein
MRAIRVPHRAVLHEAVALFAAYHAAAMRRRGIERIYSYDEDFDRLGVRREEP